MLILTPFEQELQLYGHFGYFLLCDKELAALSIGHIFHN